MTSKRMTRTIEAALAILAPRSGIAGGATQPGGGEASDAQRPDSNHLVPADTNRPA